MMDYGKVELVGFEGIGYRIVDGNGNTLIGPTTFDKDFVGYALRCVNALDDLNPEGVGPLVKAVEIALATHDKWMSRARDNTSFNEIGKALSGVWKEGKNE